MRKIGVYHVVVGALCKLVKSQGWYLHLSILLNENTWVTTDH